jgi:hypothetical protein
VWGKSGWQIGGGWVELWFARYGKKGDEISADLVRKGVELIKWRLAEPSKGKESDGNKEGAGI